METADAVVEDEIGPPLSLVVPCKLVYEVADPGLENISGFQACRTEDHEA